MTEGIIQKVISEEINRLRELYYKIGDPKEAENRKLYLEILQLKLIEEIQKKRVWQWNAVSLKDLIGDTE